MADTSNDDETELAPGDVCPCDGCAGHLDVAPTVNCSCHISAPCSACENAGLLCDTCGHDTTPEPFEWSAEIERRADAWEDRRGARRDHFTHTRTANPYNSTPFTACCDIAAINTDRCPHCEALIQWHDDGLAARRRQVGPGNCLMCGQKRGELGAPGTCCC